MDWKRDRKKKTGRWSKEAKIDKKIGGALARQREGKKKKETNPKKDQKTKSKDKKKERK